MAAGRLGARGDPVGGRCRRRSGVAELVLLDITMPWLNGFEVLHWIRARREFAELPVVMLSYSIQDADRRTARLLGAAQFRVKTRTVAGMAAMLQELNLEHLALKASGGSEAPGEPRPPAGVYRDGRMADGRWARGAIAC